MVEGSPLTSCEGPEKLSRFCGSVPLLKAATVDFMFARFASYSEVLGFL